MLQERGIEFTYREYTKDPLSGDEIREILAALGVSAKDVLRSRDAKKAGLTGAEGDDALIAAMAENPKLLQRPILLTERGAAVGRPVDALEAVQARSKRCRVQKGVPLASTAVDRRREPVLGALRCVLGVCHRAARSTRRSAGRR